MEKVKFGKVTSAEFPADNKENLSRAYDISGQVNVQNDSVNSVSAGIVKDKESGSLLADFNSYDNGIMNVTFHDRTQAAGILESITNFIDAADDVAKEGFCSQNL